MVRFIEAERTVAARSWGQEEKGSLCLMLIEVQVVGWGKEFWRLGAQNVNTVSTVRCTLTKVMVVFKAVCILP